LAPRIGFAYRASQRGNLVVRGGWGTYSVDAGTSLNNFRLFDSGPFSLTETFLNPGRLIGATPLVTLDHPFPTGLGAVPSSVSAGGAPPNIGIPVTQQYNLTVERQLAGKWVAKLGYVGSRSTQAWYTVDMNRPQAGLTPYAQVPKRFPLYQSISWFDKGGNAWYNALQAGLTHRFSSGLEFDSLFQWISELTDVQDLGLRTNAFVGADNPYCRACEKGKNQSVDSLDFRSNFLYELPVGRNRRFGGGWNRAARGIAGNWVLSGIVDLRNGRPEAVFFSGPDPSNTNLRTGRADVLPGCNYQSGDGRTAPYLNIACFAVPKAGTFGNSTTSQFRKPGSWDVSGAVYKYFPLFREDVKLRINGVFTNLFNHPTWNTVGNNISTPATFGKFSGQGAAGRLSGARSIVLQAQVQW
jgi:hypothetical protein